MDMMILRFITNNYVDIKSVHMELKNVVRKTVKCGVEEHCLNNMFKLLLVWIPKAEKFVMDTMIARAEAFTKSEEP